MRFEKDFLMLEEAFKKDPLTASVRFPELMMKYRPLWLFVWNPEWMKKHHPEEYAKFVEGSL